VAEEAVLSRINIFVSIFYPMSEGDEELPKEEEEDKLESIDRTLRELLKWTRFANIGKLKDTLTQTLDSDQKKVAYEETDGVNGTKEAAVASGAAQDTVYGWWQQWYRIGVVTESENRKGRMVKIISLEDLGIKIPKKKTSGSPGTQTPDPDRTQETPSGGEKTE